jgi:hypothetical protein
MVLKSVIVAVTLALLCFTAAIFEAASVTAQALTDIASAQINTAPSVQVQLLQRAENSILSDWTHPTTWHAGAAEALSAAYLLDGDAQNSPALLDRSAFWAAQTVRMSPIQPNAWTRLALLAERGHVNRVCTVEECLARSWAAAPVTDPQTGCVRLQLAQRRGLLVRQDRRIDDYLASGPQIEDAARCLSFLPPSEVFQAIMRHRGQPKP